MTGTCVGCGTLLEGRQKKWCADTDCRKQAVRDQWLRKIYDITLEEYDAILAFQGGGCGICGREPGPGRSLAVDHEHREGRTGPVRGLLCFFCNKRILGARSASVIFATADYLRDPPATAALGGERIAPGRPPRKRQPRKRRRK